jgi:hypothetical protein
VAIGETGVPDSVALISVAASRPDDAPVVSHNGFPATSAGAGTWVSANGTTACALGLDDIGNAFVVVAQGLG